MDGGQKYADPQTEVAGVQQQGVQEMIQLGVAVELACTSIKRRELGT